MPRFFAEKGNVLEEKGLILIEGDDARHIARSLRMASGESVTVCDGEGTDYSCVLGRIRDELVEARIVSSSASVAEPPYGITICQALVKGDKMDTVIQKSVECGASRILPFESSRCIMKLKDSAESRLARWNRISSEAAKQCGRGRLPEVCAPVRFGDLAGCVSGCDLKLFCYEDEYGTTLGSVLRGSPLPKSVCVAVGPEGGFSPEEAKAASDAGFVSVSLGARILRTESAAPFVLAALCTFYEQ